MSLNRNKYSQAPLKNMKKEHKPRGSEPPVLEQTAPKRVRRYTALQVLLSVGLPVLFLLALLLPSPILRWGFIGLSALCVAMMWLLKAFVKNARTTLSLIYAVLSVVVGVAIITSMPSTNTRTPQVVDTSSVFNQGSVLDTPTLTDENSWINATVTPPSNAQVSNAQLRLEEFMGYWALNQTENMIALCRPAWVANTDTPERSLFNLLGLTRPTSYQVMEVYGSDADSSRTIEMYVNMLQSNGTQLTKRYQVILVRTNDVWYIDPDSLNSISTVETTPSPDGDPLAEEDENVDYYVPTATPTPTLNPATVLYYNVDGGSYYHADANCKSVNEKYRPLTGTFMYAEVSTDTYRRLLRCPRCNAPERPGITSN